MPFLPMKTVYRRKADGAKSTRFVGLLPRKLTLGRSFKATRFFKHRRTMFDEVDIVRLGDVLNRQSRGVFKAKTGVRQESRLELLGHVARRLREVVLAHWTPGGVHAVLHSSGLDSRCLSWTIKQLHKELGDEWLGQVVFCCTKWEGKTFRRIMEYEGWAPHQYMVASEELLPDMYYSRELCDFSNAWRWSDGASALPVNLFWYPVCEAIHEGLLDYSRDMQTWTGQWGNTVLDAGSGEEGGARILKMVKKFYYSVLCQRPIYGDFVVLPYTDTALAKLICESSIRLGKRLRPLLAGYLDPRLASFVNEAADGDRHRHIGDRVMRQARADYDLSWYGSEVRPHAKPRHQTTEFQAYWYHWTAASLCEMLRKNGYEIGVRR